jgi:hypothetical protein
MTTNNLRIIAAVIAVVFAVLTGLFSGMMGGGTQCTIMERPATGGTGQNQEASPAGNPGPREPGQQPTSVGDPRQPAVPDSPGNVGDDEVQVEARAVEPLAAVEPVCQDRGFSPLSALIGFFGTLLAAGAVLALWFSRDNTDPARPTTAAPPREHPDGDRSTLVQACIYVRDRVTSKALADRLGWALQEAGVSTVAPAGARFDPGLHEAGGSVGTEDPAKAGTVAGVEMPGYVDRGVVLRAPVVTVYRQDVK